MSSRTTRIIKEARGLLWPWCGVMIVASLPLYYPLGFFLGIPLLASLSFGYEFRHRTLSLLLSQPVDRMKIWGEKSSVVLIAVLPVILVCGSQAADFGSHRAREMFNQSPDEAIASLVVLAALWFVVTVSSAALLTLRSRSTLGGFGLLLVQSVFYAIAFIFVMLASWKVSGVIQWFGITIWAEYQWLFIISFVFLCYAGVMLWLGRRELAQFQIAGGMTGDDQPMAGPNVMPEGLAGLFRCRPAGASLNLIRKELRLLRPLWLLTLLFALGETGLRLTSRFLPGVSGTRLVLSLMLMVVIVLPVLAGSLSLGEERTSGRQLWHMTQPVSVRRQWLIKLVIALFAGFISAVVVVAAAEQLLPAWPLEMAPARTDMLLLLFMSLLVTLAAFWCACAVNGTMRAVLLVLPAMAALSIAGRFGRSLGELAAGTPMYIVASSFHPFAFAHLELRGAHDQAALVWLVVPTVLLGMIQSYRLFRTEPQDSLRSVVRHLMPLAIVAFLCAFSLRVVLGLRGPT